MKIFLDTAIVSEIEERMPTGIIKGVTTNPTLIKRSGKDPDKTYVKIFDAGVNDLSIEVKGEDADTLIANGIMYSRKFGDKATIKLPCTVEGIKACKTLSILQIRVNMTLVFSVSQAILCSLAGASYVSPFVGRFDDRGDDGIGLIRDIAQVFCTHGSKTQVLAASLRNARSAAKAFQAGAHICTLPVKVFDDMFKHELTDIGLEQFRLDFGVNV